MNYGFVTGLPRSGSAWLANYLSYGDCMFLHDPWKNTTPGDARSRFENSEYKACGVVDSGNLFILDEIDKEFPDAQWVLVTRPTSEIVTSCQNIEFPITDFTKQLQELVKRKKLLRIPFANLFDRADEIGRYIYPDWTCPSWRREQLKTMNVQLHWGRVSDQFKVPKNVLESDVLTPNKMAYFRLVKEIVNNDQHAVRFLAQAREASELYRRLAEGKAVNIPKALELLEAMSTEWLINPFVVTYSQSLVPAIMGCIEKYRNMPDLEHCPIDVDLLTTVTYIFKGNDGVKEYMPKVRELSDKILKEKVN